MASGEELIPWQRSEKSFTAFIEIKALRSIQIRAKSMAEAEEIAKLELKRIWGDGPPNPNCTLKKLPVADELIFRVSERVDSVFSATSGVGTTTQAP